MNLSSTELIAILLAPDKAILLAKNLLENPVKNERRNEPFIYSLPRHAEHPMLPEIPLWQIFCPTWYQSHVLIIFS
ncbi:ORFVII [Mirabilis mosaic virus]|uniref:ORFVII n=1 Tax=Mirabilis mosaic virus TaxID=194445 RepID=Q8JTA7_9VIRU|nr:hypothetical protein [Mirabilis mosaic virus]AAM53130.1 ORFVII [Mirabilis mosaic virus]